MSPLRWLATIVAYLIGGLIAIQFVSVTSGPLAAAVAGVGAAVLRGLLGARRTAALNVDVVHA